MEEEEEKLKREVERANVWEIKSKGNREREKERDRIARKTWGYFWWKFNF